MADVLKNYLLIFHLVSHVHSDCVFHCFVVCVFIFLILLLLLLVYIVQYSCTCISKRFLPLIGMV